MSNKKNNTKNTTTMKAQFTYGEVAKVFAQVEKVNNCIKNVEENKATYEGIEANFDTAFAAAGYTFRGDDGTLHEMFAEKLNAHKEYLKAVRNAYNAIKEFGKLIEIGVGYIEYTEEKVLRFIADKRYGDLASTGERVKHLAFTACKRIPFNA